MTSSAARRLRRAEKSLSKRGQGPLAELVRSTEKLKDMAGSLEKVREQIPEIEAFRIEISQVLEGLLNFEFELEAQRLIQLRLVATVTANPALLSGDPTTSIRALEEQYRAEYFAILWFVWLAQLGNP